MSSAFQCDLCEFMEPGEPLVRHKLESAETGHKSEEWCNDCQISYEQWRNGRMPLTDPVYVDDARIPVNAFDEDGA